MLFIKRGEIAIQERAPHP